MSIEIGGECFCVAKWMRARLLLLVVSAAVRVIAVRIVAIMVVVAALVVVVLEHRGVCVMRFGVNCSRMEQREKCVTNCHRNVFPFRMTENQTKPISM